MLPEGKIITLESVSGAIGKIMTRYMMKEGLKTRDDGFKMQLLDLKNSILSMSERCGSAEQREVLSVLEGKIAALEAGL